VIFEQILIEFLGSDRQVETVIEPLLGVALKRDSLCWRVHPCPKVAGG
jgi:hypothetical protein